MSKPLIATMILTLLSASILADEKTRQQVVKAPEHDINQAPANRFSGDAHFSRFPTMSSPGDVVPATVTFEAGTITHWHIHPHGQYLIVTDGEGRTQEWGKPIQTLQEGDVVICPPGVKHWHGASEHRSMTHIAISPVSPDGQGVTWLEEVELPESKSTTPDQPEAPTPVTLTEKQLSLIPIAAFSAVGDTEKLKPALVQGLESGLTVNEIKEAFAHQYAYAGFPRALTGMLTFRSLLEERRENGIEDVQGKEPSQLPDSTDYYQLGSETLEYLTDRTMEEASQPLFGNFSPTMDHALKAHLFGYLFSRNNLGYLERELVVVGTLSAIGDVNPQLHSHLTITQNLVVDPEQMERIMATLEKNVGKNVARNARGVLRDIQSP
ncbi:carboxymuconolactone decarboxylase family protein [Marinimicrobium sp. C6131]|uniref:cupin domain-containing carboxymuconolactone decarboxylase family protein n=1 Tax=Marinimicrobium sp. C6131 TaxID=3022676 RepID=UPI00223D4737|nr:carboxymuconolactone decarboxylase family protein [Marinimicrobium sp. C6131]UZJ43102.1 carboxymuconolactone decarboxylase family protein [Marinimicrobium sp. C6131]